MDVLELLDLGGANEIFIWIGAKRTVYCRMDSNNSLASQREVKAVSFNGNTKITLQIRLVIDLIKKSIAEERAITREDILNLYMDWKLQSGQRLYKEKISHKEMQYNKYWGKMMETNVYKYFEVDREEYATVYNIKAKALTWFKGNLAAAIIKGKLMVIPVIEIE